MIHHWSNLKIVSPKVGCGCPSGSYGTYIHFIETPLHIQTPISRVVENGHGSFILHFTNKEIKVCQFQKIVSIALSKLRSSVDKKYLKKIRWEASLNCFENDWTLNISKNKSCLVFNKNGLEKPNTSALHRADFILEISHIRIIHQFDDSDTLHGKIIIKAVQIRTHSPKDQDNLSACAFVDSSATSHSNLPKQCHSAYLRYFNMLKKGVPRPAVEQRMRVDGIDVSILDDSIACQKPPSLISPGQVAFTATSFQSAKLKKCIQPDSKKKTLRGGIHLGITHDDIVRTLKKLRSRDDSFIKQRNSTKAHQTVSHNLS